eukprot:4691368-Pyramimonas_sp.AAC.1
MFPQVRHGDPKLWNNPMLGISGWQDTFIPIMVHADHVPFTKKGKLSVVSWSFFLASGETWDVVMLAAAFPAKAAAKASVHGEDTWNVIWQWLCWSFKALFDGEHPRANPYCASWDPDLQPVLYAFSRCRERIAQGQWRAVIWSCCVDMEYGSNDLGLAHFNGNDPCWLRRANRTDRNVRDVSRHAAWKSTILSSREGVSTPPSSHPVWRIPGMSRFCCAGEWMHIVDLGLSPNLIGSTFWEIIHDSPLPGTNAIKLGWLWSKLCFHYDALEITKNRILDLKADNFTTPGGFACLSCKAAHARALLPVVLEIVKDPSINRGSRRDLHRIAAYEALDGAHKVIYESDGVLTDDQFRRLDEFGNKFILHYNFLTKYSLDHNHLCYNHTFKLHFFFHMIALAKFLNPQFTWACMFEDFMGKIARCGRSCAAGTTGARVGSKVLESWR